MELTELLRAKRPEILQIAAQHGASNLRIFGSIARGEAGPESDLDLLVTMANDRSLLDLIGLWQDLEDLLEHKVDVVTDAGLNVHIRERVLQEAVALFTP
ncbi:nucleotidyltransferase family protein [Candidatus Viridilinea mediisalina]|uniref:Nucleotidyltransferase n=1 Tax=Candidatus Viridilinea mediisalina TaxID=2024553 RepID=A0A2A6RNK6_9CHLR|nr:nucleotidyltransferase family protein [Candidatus Viridilinea mediisalina]PDW04684.1 nucleotidyltransferase [Candidatus Viridilinea mediisalina]